MREVTRRRWGTSAPILSTPRHIHYIKNRTPSPTGLTEVNTMDKPEPQMRVCHMVECGGLEQPHSFDDSEGALDCDGPCSIRRQAEWRARNEAKHADKQPVEAQPQQQPSYRAYAKMHRDTYLPLYKAYIAVLEQVVEGSTEAVKTARSICNLMYELQHTTRVLWDTDMMDPEVQEMEAYVFSEGTFPPRFGLYPDN